MPIVTITIHCMQRSSILSSPIQSTNAKQVQPSALAFAMPIMTMFEYNYTLLQQECYIIFGNPLQRLFMKILSDNSDNHLLNNI